jgi:hypothetical protein
VKRLTEAVRLPAGEWLEPCAGDGAIIRAINIPGVTWDAIEIRKRPMQSLEKIDKVAAVNCNALEFLQDNTLSYNVAISNPPFSLAQEFIDICRIRARHVVMLLRLNYLSSEKRHEFMSRTRPDVYVLPNRPSFVGGGKTDSIEYAWFHWHEGSTGKLRILALTTKEARTPHRRK